MDESQVGMHNWILLRNDIFNGGRETKMQWMGLSIIDSLQ